MNRQSKMNIGHKRNVIILTNQNTIKISFCRKVNNPIMMTFSLPGFQGEIDHHIPDVLFFLI